MSKMTDAKNQIWYAQNGDEVTIGFTPSFLHKMEECWHILPAGSGMIREKDPLMALETNDELISIRSPVAGTIAAFSDKAQNFPDKLTSDDVIVTVNTKAKEKLASPTPMPRGGTRPLGILDEPVARQGTGRATPIFEWAAPNHWAAQENAAIEAARIAMGRQQETEALQRAVTAAGRAAANPTPPRRRNP